MRKSILAAMIVVSVVVAHAGPRILTYQGSVLDSGGRPVPDGAYAMRFQIFGEPSGGTAVWTETDTAVEVTRGLFSSVLGDGRAFGDLFGNDLSLWLEVAIDLNGDGAFDPDETYVPRRRLAGAAWAVDADHLTGRSASYFQVRVTGSAPDGQYIKAINADGSVVTGTDADSGGDVTAVTAGTGLTGGGTGGDCVLSVQFGGNGAAATVARSDHNHDGSYAESSHNHDTRYYTEAELNTAGAGGRVHWGNLTGVPAGFADGVDNDTYNWGSITGMPAGFADGIDNDSGGDITAVTAGTGLAGGGASGAVSVSADTTYLQRRVTGSAGAGEYIQAINADGTVATAVDQIGSGDVTGVLAGAGLAGGGTGGDVTLSVRWGDDGTSELVSRADHMHPGSDIYSAVATATLALAADEAPWSGLTGVPAGFADGVDDIGSGDITSVAAGAGLIGGGASGDVSLSVDFAGSGLADAAARSDHDHDGAYVNEGQVDSITSPMLTADAVTSPKIADGAVLAEILDDDGAGSGLDADLLDGRHGSAYALDPHFHDHGQLSGLADDDHAQYFHLGQNETVTGRPAFNGGTPGVSAPFTVDSNMVVTNFNADLLDGLDAGDFAAASHNHDSRYYTEAELNTAGGGGQVHWNNLTGVPAGFADGVDDEGTAGISEVVAGAGLTGGGTSGSVTVSVQFGDEGTSDLVSRADHTHPGTDIRSAVATATLALAAAQAPWSGLTGVPAGFADGIDNVDDTVSWSEISGIVGTGSNQVAVGDHNHNGSYWRLSGNAGTTSGTDFLGTTDPVPVDLRTSGARALRLEPAPGAPNLIGGHASNHAGSGVEGATIGGGGVWDDGFGLLIPNQVKEDYATIGGGQGNLSLGLSATIGGGRGNRADAAVSTIAGGQFNSAGGSYSTVGGGTQNAATTVGATVAGGRTNGASARYTTVGGGERNISDDTWATVGGGYFNTAAGTRATIGGGSMNYADALNATIGGGDQNQATSVSTTIGGGYRNYALAAYAVVSGGDSNRATGYASNVVGGRSNQSSDYYATVGGGFSNVASSDYSAVGGGRSNLATSYSATVGGGRGNMAIAWSTTIAGGWENSAENSYATVGGGYRNRATGYRATIGGGYQHEASGASSTVGGGYSNQATAADATVGGGRYNYATSISATIAGGRSNYASGGYATVGGGQTNSATSDSATVPGGYFNRAEAPFSLAAGRRARATHAGSFVWADSRNDTDFESQRDYQFRVRAYGGAQFDDEAGNWVELMWSNLIDTSSGAHCTYGGTWTNASDRSQKENFAAVDSREVLERVAALAISEWNYKKEDPSVRHIGPVAQDFHAAFGVGKDDKHITTVDADGISLAAIQGLYRIVQEKDAKIAAQGEQIADLEERLAALEGLVVGFDRGRTLTPGGGD